MNLEACISRIEAYLKSADTQPRFVNVQNIHDLAGIRQYFAVGSNEFLSVEQYAKDDEMPDFAALLHDLEGRQGTVFLQGVTSQARLLGEGALAHQLSQLMHITSATNHIVVLCYQCEKQLNTRDSRLSRMMYFVDGTQSSFPKLVFLAEAIPAPSDALCVNGIHSIAKAIETVATDVLYVNTSKEKSAFTASVYQIAMQTSAFEVLGQKDVMTASLLETWGTEEQWGEAMKGVIGATSWALHLTERFGTCTNLDLLASNWRTFDSYTKWLYFIALKLYPPTNRWCLWVASQSANTMDQLIREVYRSLLTMSWDSPDFWDKYQERKMLLSSLGGTDAEVLDYCAMVRSKGTSAIYYLTDQSVMEKTQIFEYLNVLSEEVDQITITQLLQHIYPALYDYLRPFRFQHTLFQDYFQSYKYQKVINKITPEFEAIVDDQAGKRAFNLLLPARSEKIEAIDLEDTFVYFIDALGAEYLGYIMEKCQNKKLQPCVTICRCELPSITSINKEFVEIFEQAGATFIPDKNGVKELDEVKHHGQDSLAYSMTSLPLYIVKELEILDDILTDIQTRLMTGACKKVVIISDHGTSRLSVLSNRENKWAMATKGKHGGRCCPKSDLDECPTCATEENGFWVLANYDRFKGSRKANIEVHGGATLEEVTVPIIEITYAEGAPEIQMLSPDIQFSTMKKNAIIRFFSKGKLSNVTVEVSGMGHQNEYNAESSDGRTFAVKLYDLKKAGIYKVALSANGYKLPLSMTFTAAKEGLRENQLL